MECQVIFLNMKIFHLDLHTKQIMTQQHFLQARNDTETEIFKIRITNMGKADDLICEVSGPH